MRSPNLNIQSRIPTINPAVTTRINPNIAVGIGRTPPGGNTPRPGVSSTLPNARFSPNLSPACSYAHRDSSGECREKPVARSDGGGAGKSARIGNNGAASRKTPLAALNQTAIPNELVAEIDGSLSDAQADALARRHGLVRLQSQNFPLIGATIGLFRITDRRPLEKVRREFAADTRVRSVQLNFRYLLQDQKAAAHGGDPAQYALARLRLPQAHALASGANVTIAVIDSGIDDRHPELVNSVADNFDALGSKEGPHVHGTGIAGVIVAHARLMGSAPQARILGIRAFGTAANGPESTTFVILKALNHAALHGAQIINMSFAGPKDPLVERGIGAAAAKGMVMIAASGNAGPKSPPLYPAANANVIAVSATDARDKLFAASNRGGHVAIAAPGVDIFLPAPEEKYQMTSGTSFSAAFISGIAALMLERNPALKPGEVRSILTKTARDLGKPGHDDQFGAGAADAFAAVSAVVATPFAGGSATPAAESAPGRQQVPPTRALNEPSAAMASDGSATGGGVHRPAAK
ncbi:S8 family serine peptidase [Bradyrhizobium sp.]|uniref:S8 family serine peptidase n=1 Tax=Bradyrhizobium sp. TaxID=376 RepID=UPI0025C657D3|nr:S8 family serine peptidase [Bradyrhizobium sp.]